jgi:hypothetical protein
VIRAQVEAFFAEYATAFSRRDLDRVCELWAYPAFMAARGKAASLDAAQFRANTERLCAFYAERGLARAAKRVLDIHALSNAIAAVATEDRLYNRQGAEIANWRHAYLVSEGEEGLRVIAAFPEAELDAWQKQGRGLAPGELRFG